MENRNLKKQGTQALTRIWAQKLFFKGNFQKSFCYFKGWFSFFDQRDSMASCLLVEHLTLLILFFFTHLFVLAPFKTFQVSYLFQYIVIGLAQSWNFIRLFDWCIKYFATSGVTTYLIMSTLFFIRTSKLEKAMQCS